MIGKLQDMFTCLLNPWIVIVGKLSDKIRYRIITCCFVADLVLFCIVRYILHKESYFYNTVCGIFLMLIIALMSLDCSLVRIHWRRSLWLAWFGMCTAFSISDLLVPKKVCGLGIILALVFTGVFFVWQNHRRKDLLWKCFKDAIKFSFWLMAVISFLFRPLYAGGRYAGIFTNPNTFGLYLYIILAVYMSDLDWIVETGRTWKRSVWTYISIALVFFYLVLTQARTSLVTAVVIVFMWIVFRIIFAKKYHTWKKFIWHTVLTAAVSVALYPLFFGMVSFLPDFVGHPIIFEGEALYLSDGSKIENLGEAVIAESAQPECIVAENDAEALSGVPSNVMERILYILENTKGLNAITSGRIDIYRGYMSKLNYKGHRQISLEINGKKKNHAHNNWLQFGYTYGILSMFFYGIITVLSVGFSLKFYITQRRKNATYAFMIPAICVGFVTATLTECLFLPFEVFPAFAYWFAFGDLFVKRVPKNKFLQEIEDRESL